MALDPKNALTYTHMIASAAYSTNNAASTGVNMKGYEGPCAVVVNLGVKTVGDNDGAVTVKLQASATNSAAAATDVSTTNVATTNNTAATGVIQFDPRANFQFLFTRQVITGTNTPTYPIAATLIGVKKKQ